VRQNCEALAP